MKGKTIKRLVMVFFNIFVENRKIVSFELAEKLVQNSVLITIEEDEDLDIVEETLSDDENLKSEVPSNLESSSTSIIKNNDVVKPVKSVNKDSKDISLISFGSENLSGLVETNKSLIIEEKDELVKVDDSLSSDEDDNEEKQLKKCNRF